MVRILQLATTNSKSFLSKEQLALQSLLRLFKNTFEYRAKTLMTTTDSALFKYFEDKRPPYRVLKGGKTAVVPVYLSNQASNNLWGIIQIQSFKNIDKPTMDKVRNAINDILVPALAEPNPLNKAHPCDKINIYLNCQHPGDGIKIALDVMDQSTKTCMIYWEALTPSPSKIGDLYGLQDTLVYIKEILSLTPEQRNLFALYLNLPKKLRGAQVVFSSSSSFSDLKKLLHGETLFLEALKKHRVDVEMQYNQNQKNLILQNIISSIDSETSFSRLI
jgi:hypothetical protein